MVPFPTPAMCVHVHTRSLALAGLYFVKLALLLTLIGGVARKKDDGMRIRGESHLLLVGDPGTGKSQFLKCVAPRVFAPHSTLVTAVSFHSGSPPDLCARFLLWRILSRVSACVAPAAGRSAPHAIVLC